MPKKKLRPPRLQWIDRPLSVEPGSYSPAIGESSNHEGSWGLGLKPKLQEHGVHGVTEEQPVRAF